MASDPLCDNCKHMKVISLGNYYCKRFKIMMKDGYEMITVSKAMGCK